MATESTTPTREVLDLRLQTVTGRTLADFVTSKRSETPRRSWRLIARDIYETTGRDVTYETLRSWFPAVDVEAAALRRSEARTGAAS